MTNQKNDFERIKGREIIKLENGNKTKKERKYRIYIVNKKRMRKIAKWSKKREEYIMKFKNDF